ncbi:MAG: hypothetical protein PHE02_09700 [Lachnospiraceae bacterium]|nr:hypothetical protein [Lachnospiraceae bacterium]
MKTKFDDKIMRMAAKEEMPVPKELNNRISQILEALPEREDGSSLMKNKMPVEKKHRKKKSLRKTILLVAVFVMLFSVTVHAAIRLVQIRMEAMNHEKLEEYYITAAKSYMGHDNRNRAYMEQEEVRMKELRQAYEGGRFPKGEIKIVERYEDYGGKGIAFVPATSTFCFPEGEMTDEELLQIIDFYAKRDYSVTKIGAAAASGEYVLPEECQETERQTQTSGKDQRLDIPYTGTLELTSMAAGTDCIYLAGWEGIHRMELESSDSTLFYDAYRRDEVRKNAKITCMAEGQGQMLYAAVAYRNSEEKYVGEIWCIDKEGKLQNNISLTEQAGEEEPFYVFRMAVDGDNYLYLRTNKKDCICMVYDQSGFVSNVTDRTFRTDYLNALGVGKDGKVYTILEDASEHVAGIASINPTEGELEEIYQCAFPAEDVLIPFDLLMAGTDTDFVLWGYSGIYTYQIGDPEAVRVLAPYEASFQWEGCRYTGLWNGRILFAGTEETREVDTDGEKQYRWVPEKTTFYYRPVGDSGEIPVSGRE